MAGVMFGITTAEALDGVHRIASVMSGGVPSDGSVRCWWCGIEPELMMKISYVDFPEIWRIIEWPTAGIDHQHAERPPTPDELEQAGLEALMRIIDAVR